MSRCSRSCRSRQGSSRPLVGVAGVFLWLGVVTATGGCSGSQPPSLAEDDPALPAFIYPGEPPVVSDQGLRGLLVRLDASCSLIWVFDLETVCPATARLLAEHRDALRLQNVALVGLYTGKPEEWPSRVVPILKQADANFPCAVLEPASHSTAGVWLTRRASVPAPGLYVLSANRRVIPQAADDESSMRSCLHQLTHDPGSLSRPAGISPLYHAQVRVLDLATGRMLAQAEAEAEETAGLTQLLAVQLHAALPSAPRIAVLPFRQQDRNKPHGPDLELSLADDLCRCLVAAGWHDLIPAHQVRTVLEDLDEGRFAVEFAPDRLVAETNWQAILVGSVAILPAAGTALNRP